MVLSSVLEEMPRQTTTTTTLNDILKKVNSLKEEINDLKAELKQSKEEIKLLKLENGDLKQALNFNTAQIDDMQQYSRRENLRIYGIEKSNSNKDDGETVILNVAKTLGIQLEAKDVQRAHRLGKKKRSGKPRPIIARFVSYKKRTQFLKKKATLKENDEFKTAFIVEDLTPLRQKLLNYVKNECEEKFVLCHTFNGRIRMKRSAKIYGDIGDDEKDEGIGEWIYITSPEDLFQLNIDVDLEKLDYKPLFVNVDRSDDDESAEA